MRLGLCAYSRSLLLAVKLAWLFLLIVFLLTVESQVGLFAYGSPRLETGFGLLLAVPPVRKLDLVFLLMVHERRIPNQLLGWLLELLFSLCFPPFLAKREHGRGTKRAWDRANFPLKRQGRGGGARGLWRGGWAYSLRGWRGRSSIQGFGLERPFGI